MLVDEEDEVLPVDAGEPAGQRCGRCRVARTVFDEGQLSEDPAFTDALDELAVERDVDATLDHRVHDIAGIALPEDAFACVDLHNLARVPPHVRAHLRWLRSRSQGRTQSGTSAPVGASADRAAPGDERERAEAREINPEPRIAIGRLDPPVRGKVVAAGAVGVPADAPVGAVAGAGVVAVAAAAVMVTVAGSHAKGSVAAVRTASVISLTAGAAIPAVVVVVGAVVVVVVLAAVVGVVVAVAATAGAVVEVVVEAVVVVAGAVVVVAGAVVVVGAATRMFPADAPLMPS